MANFQVHLDYETSARAGAGGTFQLISITDDNGKDYTHIIDQGTHYLNLGDLSSDIAKALKLKSSDVDLEEV